MKERPCSWLVLSTWSTLVILPNPRRMLSQGPEALAEMGVFDEFEFEGEKESILADLYQFNLACT